MKALLVLTTAPDARTARRIARSLVDPGLAACVTELPRAISVYRWKGRTRVSPETLLLIKIRPSKFKAVEKAIKSVHPYETPEIAAIAIDDGSKDYLKWLLANSR